MCQLLTRITSKSIDISANFVSTFVSTFALKREKIVSFWILLSNLLDRSKMPNPIEDTRKTGIASTLQNRFIGAGEGNRTRF